ncbi:MAG: hypothetical protein SGARI_002869 [Bacillariaceae sp.]
MGGHKSRRMESGKTPRLVRYCYYCHTIQEEDVLILVAKGDIAGIQKVAQLDPERLRKGDKNGWTALHESVRSGKLGVLKTLIDFGMDKDLLTASKTSPLNYARYYHGKNHEITKYLESLGAKDIKDNNLVYKGNDEL